LEKESLFYFEIVNAFRDIYDHSRETPYSTLILTIFIKMDHKWERIAKAAWTQIAPGEKNINTSQPCTILFAFQDFLQIKSFPHSLNAYSTFWRNPRNPRRATAPPATFWGLAAPVKMGAFVGTGL